MNHNSAAIIPLVGMSIPIILVPTILIFRQLRLKTQYRHAERMRAIELGRPLPGEVNTGYTPSRLAADLGLKLPLGLFGIAWLASDGSGLESLPMWIAAGSVGFAGVVSGLILTCCYPAQADTGHADPEFHGSSKPRFDADAFDVVGSRG